ncbi:TrkH family potassium uptake protein [Marinibacterium sp. SX1]|uniref:TrkH family potassium uptake protein n=1 Tax=Marinibacterium sp. SX1 TaxID=3388424 RepID=UPI003D16FF36
MSRARARNRSRNGPGRLTLFLLLLAISAAAMYPPALLATMQDDDLAARSFLYAGTLGLILVALIALARGRVRPDREEMRQLLAIFGAFAFLPLYLALPFYETLQTTSFINAYLDMVSAVTTTGIDLFDDPRRLSDALHLWRAEVAWLGGLLMWVAAGAILAPMSLGGFEVTARGEPGRADPGTLMMTRADPAKRLRRVGAMLVPIYAGLTGALMMILLAAGERPLVALCHAMSVMATSGLSPVGGLDGSAAGRVGEVAMFGFMIFALSRITFSDDTLSGGRTRNLLTDPEFRVAVLLIFGVPVVLFARHWFGAYDIDMVGHPGEAARALWGGAFTVMSYLTTTGFVSTDWTMSESWSGLSASGIILMGLAMMGGGVATTAGGVKLLRVYALYLNGLREMERLVYPSSVTSAGRGQRRLQSNGAFIAWVFFMLFAVSLTVVTLVLGLFGIEFEESIVLAIATLSTTGPLIEHAADEVIPILTFSTGAKAVLCAAMVLGRLETLAIIALLTPDLWRK